MGLLLTLLQLVANLANTKWCKKQTNFKMIKTLAHEYSSESAQ